MILNAFVVFDSKANIFQGPYFARSVAAMIRDFSHVAAMDTASVFHKFGGDFSLFEVGTFDDSTGKFFNLPSHINHGTMLALGAAYIAADEALKHSQVSKEDV